KPLSAVNDFERKKYVLPFDLTQRTILGSANTFDFAEFKSLDHGRTRAGRFQHDGSMGQELKLRQIDGRIKSARLTVINLDIDATARGAPATFRHSSLRPRRAPSSK